MREWETNGSPPLISLYHDFQASPQSAFKIGLGWKQKRKPAGENEGMGRQKAWSHWFQYTPRPMKTEAWKAEHSLGRALTLRSFLLDLFPSFLPLEPIHYSHTLWLPVLWKSIFKSKITCRFATNHRRCSGFAVVEMQYSNRCCDLLQSGTVSLLITTMTRSTCSYPGFIKSSFFTSHLKQMD